MKTIKTTIDADGRLTIPEEIRRLAGLRPGMRVEVRWRDGLVEIEPELTPVRLVQEGRFLVAVPEDGGEPLTSETVEAIRQELLYERGGVE